VRDVPAGTGGSTVEENALVQRKADQAVVWSKSDRRAQIAVQNNLTLLGFHDRTSCVACGYPGHLVRRNAHGWKGMG
jgi:hypothetical protein